MIIKSVQSFNLCRKEEDFTKPSSCRPIAYRKYFSRFSNPFFIERFGSILNLLTLSLIDSIASRSKLLVIFMLFTVTAIINFQNFLTPPFHIMGMLFVIVWGMSYTSGIFSTHTALLEIVEYKDTRLMNNSLFTNFL